jgi:hypothetical protein
MIAIAKNRKCTARSRRWNDRFLELLPTIQNQAEYAFRRESFEAREELVQEAVVAAYALFLSLCRRGKAGLVYPTPLTKFAIRRVRAGRRVGSPFNRHDVTCPRHRDSIEIHIERLDQFDRRNGDWREIVVEDGKASPAEIAMTRLDFGSWLSTLSQRDRQLAEKLAFGETTGRVARMFRVSAARVSQIRRELCESWHRFIGELTDTVAARAAASARS